MTNDDRNGVSAEPEKIDPEEQLPDHYPAQNYLTSPAYINGVAAMATLCRGASTC
jgi:hypothetical protein